MLTWGYLERLRPDQVCEIRAANPVAYIPWGAIEWHGVHNPLGVDGLKAHGLCAALAQETGGVVLPPVFMGTGTMKPVYRFPLCLEFQPSTVAAACRDILGELGDEGFRVIVLLTGHYGAAHMQVLRDTCDAFARDHSDMRVLCIADWEPDPDRLPANHAARGETSYTMYFDPGLSDVSQLPDDRDTDPHQDGIIGDDARLASRAYGEELTRLFVERTAPTVRRLLNELINRS